MNKLIFLIFSLLLVVSCQPAPFHMEHVMTWSHNDGSHGHYLYVENYKKRKKYFSDLACNYADTVQYDRPISSISFIKSKRALVNYYMEYDNYDDIIGRELTEDLLASLKRASPTDSVTNVNCPERFKLIMK